MKGFIFVLNPPPLCKPCNRFPGVVLRNCFARRSLKLPFVTLDVVVAPDVR